ncbi:MAG: TIGR02147 family protein [Bacteriovorax sp.]|nr:TIGR02147 family protein [Bacteriovorax sp.]
MIKIHNIPQDEIAKILQIHLKSMQERNSSFSMRSFARKLEVNSGVLSLIINGKRNISEDFAIRFADILELTEKERVQFFSYFELQRNLNIAAEVKEINTDVLMKLPEWFHFAILSIVKLDNFIPSPENISKRLGITLEEAISGIDFLVAQDLLARDEKDGKLQRTAVTLKTPDNIPNDYLKNAQANNLKMGVDSIFKDDVAIRDFTAMTMAIDPDKIQYAKELIRKFQKDISLMLEHGEKKEVYKMVVGLYPLTRSS